MKAAAKPTRTTMARPRTRKDVAQVATRTRARPGDLFVAEVPNNAIVLRRKQRIDPDQAYFWTEEWQRGEREATEDIKNGRYKSFRSARALIADLKG